MGNWSSLLLVITSIITALVWQFYIARSMDDNSITKYAWSRHCHSDSNNYPKCLEYAATYRVSFAAVIVFFIMALLTYKLPALHDRGWDIKFLLLSALIIAFVWAPNGVFDTHGYVWFARIGGFVFLILQQIILVDFAFTLNEKLTSLGFSGSGSGSRESQGMNSYLYLLLTLSIVIYLAAFIGLVLLFVYFSGCSNSNAFMSITLILIVLFTLLQLFSDPALGHNFLVSSVVAAYSVYLTYVSVSANPIETCNPLYTKSNNYLAIVLGLIVTFVSLCGTVYFASTTVTNLLDNTSRKSNISVADVLTSDVNTNTQPKPKKAATTDAEAGEEEEAEVEVAEGGRAWKFNVVMVLICMYWCMVLTNWGNAEGSAGSSSPTAGKVTAWINIAACWVCMGLYVWTLLAPKLFPDRDFSAH